MAELIVMGSNGHTEWAVEDAEAVAVAERILGEYLAKGAAAFAVAPDKTSERIREFDPNAYEIIVVPRIAGGGDA